MGKLSIGKTALEGVRLVGRRPASLLAWASVFFLLAVLPSAAIAWQRAETGAPHATLIQSAALLSSALPLLSLPAWAVIYAAIYRSVLLPDQARAPFLRASAAELRQLLLLVIRTLVLLVMVWGAAFAIGFAGGIATVLPEPYALGMRIFGPLGVIVLALLIWLRLSMSPPMTFAEGRLRFFTSWTFTRDRVLVLLGLMILVLLTTILAEVIAFITLFGLLEVLAGMLRWRADQLQAVFSHPISLAEAPWLIGLGLAYSVVVVFVQCVGLVPWVRAYQAIAAAPAPAAPAALATRATAFGPLPAGARIGPAWSAPVILILGMSFAMGLLTLGLLIAIALARQGGLAMTTQALNGWLGELGLSVGFDLLVVALLLLWTRKVEKRSLASAGLGGRVSLGDLGWFAGGAIWAFVLALGLGLAAQTVAMAAMDPQSSAEGLMLPPQALAQAPGVLLVIVLLAFSEEVMFRGWLLSALAPRTGLAWAISISSLLFAAFHVLPWELGDPARLISFLSYAAIGAGFAAVALGRGQLWSSTALHAGYNSFLAFATMAAQHATPQKLWGAVSEQRRGATESNEALMTLGLNLAIGALLFALLLLARRRRTPVAAAATVLAN